GWISSWFSRTSFISKLGNNACLFIYLFIYLFIIYLLAWISKLVLIKRKKKLILLLTKKKK
ncbi:MAG: hypothetical protein N7Q72_06085, partial [Spiroplasma sp. Tabriz.8]|nr:hypothetical protein [Spiroplasma sp. Tabriz.8]